MLSCQPLLQRLLVGGFNSEKQWHISPGMHRQNSSLHFKTQKKPEKQKNPIDSLILHHIFHTFVVDKFPCFTQKKPLKPPNRTVPKNPGNASHSQAHHLEANLDNTSLQTSKKSKGRSSLQKTHVICSAREGDELAVVFVWGGFLFIETTWSNHSPYTVGNPWKWLQQLLGHAVPAVKNKRTPMCGDFFGSDFPHPEKPRFFLDSQLCGFHWTLLTSPASFFRW